MKLPRLLLPSLLVSAFALAACGNKADLFMPLPPEPAEVADPPDAADPFDDETLDGEPAADPFEDEPALPVPVPTGDE